MPDHMAVKSHSDVDGPVVTADFLAYYLPDQVLRSLNVISALLVAEYCRKLPVGRYNCPLRKAGNAYLAH